MGGRDRRILRSRRPISKTASASTVPPSRARAPARQRLVARSARSHHPGRTASHRWAARDGRRALRGGDRSARVREVGENRVSPKDRGFDRHGATGQQIKSLPCLIAHRHEHFSAARHRSHRQLLCAHGPVSDEPGAAVSRHRGARTRTKARLPAFADDAASRPRRRHTTRRRPADAKDRNPADPYMTALCYFNALRELGGARRIVEDEVRDRAARYGAERRRVDPPIALSPIDASRNRWNSPRAFRPMRSPRQSSGWRPYSDGMLKRSMSRSRPT